MFKKIFGPNKFEGKGEPAELDELRKALLAFFPQEKGINPDLSIEVTDQVNEGFEAQWEFYIRDRDPEGAKQNYLLQHTVFVDIRPDEKAVYLKTRHFARTKRVPEGKQVYEPWFHQVRIGRLEALEKENVSKIRSYNSKKILEPLVNQVIDMGWDAYL